MQAYLINPIRSKKRKSRRAKKRRNNMARKKLYGAALKSWKKARRRGGKKRRKNPCASPIGYARKNAKKRRYPKRRKVSNVKAYRRKPTVKAHRRNPVFGLPTFRGLTGTVQEGLMGAAALAGTFFAVAWVNRMAERTFPRLAVGLPNLALKLGVASATAWGASRVLRGTGLTKVAVAGAYFPIGLEGLGKVAPQLAAQVPMIGYASAPAAAAQQMGMVPGPRLSDYTLDASLEAELEADSEMSLY